MTKTIEPPVAGRRQQPIVSRLTPQQAEFLILLSERSEVDDAGQFWVPPDGLKQARSEILGRTLFVDGGGVATTLKSLVRRGLAKYAGLDNAERCYFMRITEEGRLLVEHWRETNSWPVTVSC